ncbi:hypothetical protein BH20ACT16_BH20ACT16_12370 [soil metagenome]|jgi:hypothetical protein
MFKNNFIRASKSVDGKTLLITAKSEAAAEIEEIRMTWAKAPAPGALLAMGTDLLPSEEQTQIVMDGPFTSPWTAEIPLECASVDTTFLIAASALRRRKDAAAGTETFEADTWLGYIPLKTGLGATSLEHGAPKGASSTSRGGTPVVPVQPMP